jgi:hypothetical protein
MRFHCYLIQFNSLSVDYGLLCAELSAIDLARYKAGLVVPATCAAHAQWERKLNKTIRDFSDNNDWTFENIHELWLQDNPRVFAEVLCWLVMTYKSDVFDENKPAGYENELIPRTWVTGFNVIQGLVNKWTVAFNQNVPRDEYRRCYRLFNSKQRDNNQKGDPEFFPSECSCFR